jgi:hypothetical protein
MVRKYLYCWGAACCLGGVLLFQGAAIAQKPALPGPEALQVGARLLQRLKAGSLKLTNPTREGVQLRQIARNGAVTGHDGRAVPISIQVLRTLDRLSARSTREKPLELMSLYRSPRSRGSGSAHGSGMALDVAAFGGYRIESRSPEKCVNGVVAVIAALGPGDYRVGLPKPPRTDPIPFLPPPGRPGNWAFFPAPLPYTVQLIGWTLVLPQPPAVRPPRPDRPLRPWVARWENERGAPLVDIGDRRVRLAIRDALARRTNIYSVFPDALDHLHLDVRPLGKR